MSTHEKFSFRTIEELQAKVASLELDIQFDEDLSPLGRPVTIGAVQVPNSLGIHPMEGSDGSAEGTPGELTVRRYERFAAGGAGLLWFEATAVVPEGRANPRQLRLHEDNLEEYKRLVGKIEQAALIEYGHRPLTVIQLTHSGRFSRPEGKPAPIIAWHNPVLDAWHNLSPTHPVITDDRLEALEDEFAAAAKLAWEAGFPAADLKATHGYLCAELLGSHERPGRYGGSFENRTRFLLNIVDKVRDAVPGMLLAVRLAGCNGLDYPHSWGMDREVPGREDLSETTQLVRLLYDRGVRLVSVSVGIGRYLTHWLQPYDQPTRNRVLPNEHPLEGVARQFRVTRAIQQAVPEIVCMGAGYSWLRQYFPFAAAANLKGGSQRIAGVGRMAIAYPDFARDLLQRGALDLKKLCTTCSKCSQLMYDDGMVGCVTHDSKIYVPMYREYCQKV